MWNSIKLILKDNKTKCIIVEDGEPKYVILPFREYQQLQKSENHDTLDEDKANKEIEEEMGNGEKEIEDISYEQLQSGASTASTVRIEDLPF